MKKWFQKSIIITVALLTFGLISPSHFIWEQILDTKSPPRAISSDVSDYEQVTITEEAPTYEHMAVAAREQAYIKFGNRIGPVIQNEFDDVIFPKIQEVIDMTIAKALEQNRELAELYSEDETTKKLIDISISLEGMPKNASTHACRSCYY